MLGFDQNKTHQRWKIYYSNEFCRTSDVSENSKVYYGRFLRNGLYEGIAILVQLLKVDEMYNILKSASHCLLVKR